MNKFCDNPKCKHHIDVSNAIFDSGHMYVPDARNRRRIRDRINFAVTPTKWSGLPSCSNLQKNKEG